MRVRLRDGRHLAVTDRGAGPACVLLHGFMGSRRAWGEALEELDGLRVIALDLMGHGDSDRPAEPARYAMSEVVRDVSDVLDALGVERAAWVGYSMGGRVALAGALDLPERVGVLVLESASPGIADPEAREERRAADETRARALERGGIEAFVEAWDDQPLFASRRRLPAPVRDALRAVQLANDPHALAACLRGLGTGRQPSLWPRLNELRAPVHLITGALDEKFAAIAGQMREALPAGRAQHHVVADAGHTVHLERPGAWSRLVREAVTA